MARVSPLHPTKEKMPTTNNISFVQEKPDKASSRRPSYVSAMQANNFILDKNERYGATCHDHGYHNRSTSVDTTSTFEEGAVMESGSRGYLVVFGGFLTIMVAIGYVSIYGIFQSQYDDIYGAQGASTSDVSLVGSLAVGFQFGFTIISGPLMNRFGYKVVLWSGSIIGSLGLLLASWGSQLWHLYLTQGAMFGIGVSLLNLAVTAILPLWYDKYRSFAMGICFCGAGIGGLVFGFIIPALINAVGLRWALRIFAILHFVCTAFASIVIRAPRQLSGSRIIVPKEVLNLQILKDPGFIFLLISAAFFGFAYMVPFTYIPSYTKDVVGLDPNIQGGHLISIMSAANAVGLITIGFAADCLGVIRVTTFILMAAGASCFLWMASYSYSALVWFSIMYGFFSGGFFILVAAIIANTIGLANLGSGLTIIFLVNTPGNILTLPIAGNMLGSTGGYKGMIGYNAAMYFGAALFLCILMFYNHYIRKVDAV